VKISQFGIEIIRGFQERMAPFYTDEPAPDLGFKETWLSLLLLARGRRRGHAERVELQRSLGAHTVFLEPGPLKERFPWLNCRRSSAAVPGAPAERAGSIPWAC